MGLGVMVTMEKTMMMFIMMLLVDNDLRLLVLRNLDVVRLDNGLCHVWRRLDNVDVLDDLLYDILYDWLDLLVYNRDLYCALVQHRDLNPLLHNNLVNFLLYGDLHLLVDGLVVSCVLDNGGQCLGGSHASGSLDNS